MPALALFGITNEGLNLAVNLLVLFLVVVYIALVVYTYMDARRRLEDPVLVTTATVASLFPFVGTVIYTILRPPEFLDDKRERELEMQASRLRVRQLEEASCPNCSHPIERTYLRCPKCRARVKDPCESCAKPIDPRWSVCPYCETPVRRAQPQPPRKQRRGAPKPPRQRRTGSQEQRPEQRPSASGTGGGAPAAPTRPAARKPSGGGGRPPSEVKAPTRSPSKASGSGSGGSGSGSGNAKRTGTGNTQRSDGSGAKRNQRGAPTQEAPAVPEREPAD